MENPIIAEPVRWTDKSRTVNALLVANIVTCLLALAGLSIAILGLTNQKEIRRDAARDSCQLLRGLVFHATEGNPKGRKAAAHYVAGTPLRDCTVYAKDIVK